MDHVAVSVGEDLDLDVSGVGEVALEVDSRVPEELLALPGGAFERGFELVGRQGDPEALAAAAAGRLDGHWIADAAGVDDLLGSRQALDRLGRAGNDRNAGCGHQLAGARLGPHRVDRGGRRADEDDPGVLARPGEGGVLGEKAVAGVDSIGAGFLRGVENAIDAQVTLARRRGPDRHRFIGVENVQRGAVRLGVNGHRRVANFAAGAHDANRNLAAIRNQDFHRGALYSLLTSAPMTEEPLHDQRTQILSGVVKTLLDDLKNGAGDKDRRRQVEEWMRTLAEKYPEFQIESGLRDYYLAEAERLRVDFEKAAELNEKLALGRSIEGFLDRAADYAKRIAEK